MISMKGGLILIITCMGTLLVACQRTTGNANSNEAGDSSPVVAPPAIITYILEEEQGIDSLSLKQVVVGQGYLKKELASSVGKALPNQFRISLLGNSEDTLAQVLLSSALNEHLESSLEDGTIRSIEVDHPIAVHIIRTSKPKAHTIIIERANNLGEIIATQRLEMLND